MHVFLLAQRDPRRQYELHRNDWQFDGSVLSGWDAQVGRRWIVLNRRVANELRRFRPDLVIVGGWHRPAFFQAARYARTTRTPLVVWVESTPRDERSGGLLLERLKRWFASAADAFLVPGQAASDYVRSYGVRPEQIAVAPNAVDPAFTSRVADERRRRDEIRRELGLAGCCFVCVSRLSREKGVDILLRAFGGVSGELVVIGGGRQESELRRLAPPTVRLLGHVPRDDLPRWYAAGDAFVLASRSETWGMALNEAAAAGLPLVATDAAGAAHELIEDGVNGFRVPAEDEQALHAALLRVADDEAFRDGARQRSLALGGRATPEGWAQAVLDLGRSLRAGNGRHDLEPARRASGLQRR